MKIYNTIKTARQEIRNFINEKISKNPVNLSENESRVLSEVLERGFAIVPNFYSEETSRSMRDEIDRLVEKHGTELFVDNKDSDHRIFGADKLSPIISPFINDNFIKHIVHAHEKTTNVNGVTMAAKLEYKPGNAGSGGGWHRDTPHSKQIKAIMYLSKVDRNAGPFQYLEGSHRGLNVTRDILKGGFNFNQNRFTDEEIARLPYTEENGKLHTINGEAGTLIIVNTRGLHRGMPIMSGTRYALTNYYWSNKPIPQETLDIMAKLGIKG